MGVMGNMGMREDDGGSKDAGCWGLWDAGRYWRMLGGMGTLGDMGMQRDARMLGDTGGCWGLWDACGTEGR